jgi:hypothetical protein
MRMHHMQGDAADDVDGRANGDSHDGEQAGCHCPCPGQPHLRTIPSTEATLRCFSLIRIPLRVGMGARDRLGAPNTI